MSDRIPSSLKWLVTKRKQIYSEILQIQNETLDLFLKSQSSIEKLRENLKAIDETIKLHEIVVDPEKIEATRKYEKSLPFKYGELTRLIYQCLSSKGNSGKTTIEVADYINLKTELEQALYNKLKKAVRYRLKDLYRQGKVEKICQGNERLWFLLDPFKT